MGYHPCADPGGGHGGLGPPPSPQNIAPPNSEARAKRALAPPPPPGGQGGLGPPPPLQNPGSAYAITERGLPPSPKIDKGLSVLEVSLIPAVSHIYIYRWLSLHQRHQNDLMQEVSYTLGVYFPPPSLSLSLPIPPPPSAVRDTS